MDILVSLHFCCQQRPGNGVLVLRAPGPGGCRTDLFDFGAGVTLALDDVRQPSRRLGILYLFSRNLGLLCGFGSRSSPRTWWPSGYRKVIPVWGAHLCSVCPFATMPQDLPLSKVSSWKCGLSGTRVGEASHPGPTGILEAALLEAHPPHDQTLSLPPLPPGILSLRPGWRCLRQFGHVGSLAGPVACGLLSQVLHTCVARSLLTLLSVRWPLVLHHCPLSSRGLDLLQVLRQKHQCLFFQGF